MAISTLMSYDQQGTIVCASLVQLCEKLIQVSLMEVEYRWQALDSIPSMSVNQWIYSKPITASKA